jgi:N-acetylneuraminic acid mutarotase
MKTINLLLRVSYILIFTCLIHAISFAQSEWTQKSDFPGGVRYGGISFSIDTKGYVGLGFNDADMPMRDFWEWDQATDVWTRKADYPGNIEGSAVSFSIGTKGYVGTGYSSITNGFTNDFWEYDPTTDSWTQKASLPTTPARAFATGFSIGTQGYIGIGELDPYKSANMSTYYPDLWEWDQASNEWTQKADYIGVSSMGAVGFSIGNKGYIVTGFAGMDGTIFPYAYSEDLEEWDQATNSWTTQADFGLIAYGRSEAVGFAIGTKAYVGTGLNGTNLMKDFWEWDQTTNLWTRKADFPGLARAEAIAFTIGNKGYIGTGGTGVNPNYALQDFWEYDPSREVTGLTDLSKSGLDIYPNPASEFVTLKYERQNNDEIKVNVYGVTGELVKSEILGQNQQSISVKDLKEGIYLVEIQSTNWTKNQKIVIQR